jgi:hypothetical protein
MKLVFLDTSGMVGAGVLREALAPPEVEAVLSIGRSPSGVAYTKLREFILPDPFDIASVKGAEPSRRGDRP